jgi:ABC-type polysaccharide/polyol phosphate transport system ATPase subunit
MSLALESERERRSTIRDPHAATKKTARLETQDVFWHHRDTFLKVASATRIGLVGEGGTGREGTGREGFGCRMEGRRGGACRVDANETT